jgi:hypothetical protein
MPSGFWHTGLRLRELPQPALHRGAPAGRCFSALFRRGPRKQTRLAPNLLESVAGYTDAARLALVLDSGRDIDAIAQNVVAVDDNDAEFHVDQIVVGVRKEGRPLVGAGYHGRCGHSWRLNMVPLFRYSLQQAFQTLAVLVEIDRAACKGLL